MSSNKDAIIAELDTLSGTDPTEVQNRYAELWDQIPPAQLEPKDFGRIQWGRGKNFYLIPDTAMLHVALQPERNARAIELFYKIVKEPDGYLRGGNYKTYDYNAAFLLSHFRNTMQYYFAAEICNYFLYHLSKDEGKEPGTEVVKWRSEPFVIENNILEKNYIPERVFPATLPIFGIPEKLSIKFRQIEADTKKNYIQENNPNFYFIQQVSRFLGRNAERFMSGVTFAYAFTQDDLKPTEETVIEELLIEECKSFWGSGFSNFQVRKDGKNRSQVISIYDQYEYKRAHVYAVDPVESSDSAKNITTISIVIAGSPTDFNWNAASLWWNTNLGIFNFGSNYSESRKIAGEEVACHAGMYKMYSHIFYGDKKKPNEMSIEKAVAQLVKETNPNNDIEIRVSGHSLGGALAQMLALDFDCSKVERLRELYCVTLNSPPAFGKVPQLKYPQKVQLVHFYHRYDPVVLTPSVLYYYNVGIQVPMTSESSSMVAVPKSYFHKYSTVFEWFNKIAITPYKTYFEPPPHLGSNLPVDNTRVSPNVRKPKDKKL